MSFGEPIALRPQAEMERVAGMAPQAEARVPVVSPAEIQFIDRLRAGEAAAFERLVADRTNDVYALLYRLTEDAEEARDLTQETFLLAFRNIQHFRGDADLRTWLYRIAVNQARNRWRWWKRRRRERTVSLDAPMSREGETTLADMMPAHNLRDPEQTTLSHEREVRLLEAVRSLGRPYREAVVLRDIEGLSYEEVSLALGISVGTVKSRLSRGRAELRRRLEGSL